MRIEKSFDVSKPVDDVWLALTDLTRVSRSLPGADLTDVDSDGVHHGTVTLKLGPTSLSFLGRAQITEQDRTARRIVVVASGRERRGRGGVQASIPIEFTGHPGGTTVAVATVVQLSGLAAQLSRRGGILDDVSGEMVEAFVDSLKADIEQGEQGPTARQAAALAPSDLGALPTRIDSECGLWAYLPPPGEDLPHIAWPPQSAPSSLETQTQPQPRGISGLTLARRVAARRVSRLATRLRQRIQRLRQEAPTR